MSTTYLVLFLGFAWVLQFVLSYLQMRRFYGRISQLRRQLKGSVAIGMAGSAWKRRQYAVLVIDANKHILAAEQLSGWTVWAGLKPVQGLAGYTLAELRDDRAILPVSNNKKLLLALRNAADQVETAEEKARIRAQSLEENATAEVTVPA